MSPTTCASSSEARSRLIAGQRVRRVGGAELQPGLDQVDLGDQVGEAPGEVGQALLRRTGLPGADHPFARGGLDVDGAVRVHPSEGSPVAHVPILVLPASSGGVSRDHRHSAATSSTGHCHRSARGRVERPVRRTVTIRCPCVAPDGTSAECSPGGRYRWSRAPGRRRCLPPPAADRPRGRPRAAARAGRAARRLPTPPGAAAGAAGPDTVLIVGAAPRTPPLRPPDDAGDLRAYGVAVDSRPGRARPGRSDAAAAEPDGRGVAAARGAGTGVPPASRTASPPTPPPECARLGARLAPSSPPSRRAGSALLVIGDGIGLPRREGARLRRSARRGVRPARRGRARRGRHPAPCSAWTRRCRPSCGRPAAPPWQVLAGAAGRGRRLARRAELRRRPLRCGVLRGDLGAPAVNVLPDSPAVRGERAARRPDGARGGRADRGRQVRAQPRPGPRARRRGGQRRLDAALPRAWTSAPPS